MIVEGRDVRKTARKLVWWTDELENLKRRVRRNRCAYQLASKNSRGRVVEKVMAYKYIVYEYKKELWKIKKDNWKELWKIKKDNWFMSESSNQDS